MYDPIVKALIGGTMAPKVANLQPYGQDQIPRNMHPLTAPGFQGRDPWDLYWEQQREPQPPAPAPFEPPQDQRRRFIPAG